MENHEKILKIHRESMKIVGKFMEIIIAKHPGAVLLQTLPGPLSSLSKASDVGANVGMRSSSINHLEGHVAEDSSDTVASNIRSDRPRVCGLRRNLEMNFPISARTCRTERASTTIAEAANRHRCGEVRAHGPRNLPR